MNVTDATIEVQIWNEHLSPDDISHQIDSLGWTTCSVVIHSDSDESESED